MITLDAFLVFLAAASLPVIYLLLMSRWIERDYRQTHPDEEAPQARTAHPRLVRKAA